ncbi:M28 family peptidase [Pontibacter beigongshangensis]|uniref:M28 family peptidase n=1 Tax=Pontibacter beigongshangensis TaxID=2574733 RepID=UPI00164FC518|nr:M28 family peptidase [Pontibacter beigongshangensis]
MKKLLILLFLVWHLPAGAQQIIIDTTQLLHDIRTLAADSMEGRQSGTAGNGRAQQYLERRFREIGLQPFGDSYRQHFRLQTQKLVVEQAANLIGYIPGDPAKVLVITAHYDHIGQQDGQIFNGADDNASGVGALLAAAAHFQQHRPRHTIIFAALDGEELGLQGAAAFLKSPPVPLGHIVLNINLDMLSISQKKELYASGTFHHPWLRPYLLQVQPLPNARLVLGHDRPEQGRDDWTKQSDHFQFHKRRIPYIYFGVEDHAHYHKPTDTFQNIDPAFYTDAAALVIDFIRIADAHESPQQKPVK